MVPSSQTVMSMELKREARPSCLLELIPSVAVILMNGLLIYLWYAYVFMTKSSIHGMMLVSVLLAVTAWCYNRTAFTDPGTARCDEWKLWAAGAPELGELDCVGRTSGKRCWQAGQAVWCSRCSAVRPERAHHCRRCGVCVLRMDHHCPVIGTCVGWRNHKYFVLTAWWGFWACLAALVTAREPSIFFIVVLINEGPHLYPTDSLHVALYTMAFLIACTLMIFCLILFLADMFMAMRNINRVEFGYAGPSPYRQPRSLDNIQQLFGTINMKLLLPLEPDGRTSDGAHFPLTGEHASNFRLKCEYVGRTRHE